MRGALPGGYGVRTFERLRTHRDLFGLPLEEMTPAAQPFQGAFLRDSANNRAVDT